MLLDDTKNTTRNAEEVEDETKTGTDTKQGAERGDSAYGDDDISRFSACSIPKLRNDFAKDFHIEFPSDQFHAFSIATGTRLFVGREDQGIYRNRLDESFDFH